MEVGEPLPPVDDLHPEPSRARRTLIGLTAGLLAGAAGSWAVAVGTRVSSDRGADGDALVVTNHVMVPLSGVFGVAGLATGVAALTVRPRCS